MNQIHNERIKLLATFLNGLGIAVFGVGGLAPVFSSLNSATGTPLFLIPVSIICFLTAGALHYVASTILKRLKP
ncbi:amino acid transporter [Martelella radicis]|uniref:Putative membrane protein YfcA n=1 Tax=Martelella radicis TaxID=1397476 RepID=A0A7W6KNX5_9HYPH|nr:amino acid transporter [Martelella radicis]MBB4123278.1 putative membrane protein YfcA [Martelella radicis]